MKPAANPIQSGPNGSPIFVNTVLARGILNGVVNLTFGQYQFTPDAEEPKIHSDQVIACRLRMDVMCLENLHRVTGELIQDIKKQQAAISKGEAEEASQESGAKPKKKPN
jgi:hypothetical protein